MTTQVLSPLDLGNATQVGGRIFRKQILPIGSINYNGRRIDFTRERLEQMAQAFRDGAYDAVPLVFADAQNRHTMDPTAATGEVIGMEVTDDGLDVIVEASPEAATLLSQYPKVGISARIIENLQRADGKFFPAAIQHALITWDPRITGMRPWEAVELSAEAADDVIDLTGLVFSRPGGRAGAFPQEETMGSEMSDDEFGFFGGGDVPAGELTLEQLNRFAEETLAAGGADFAEFDGEDFAEFDGEEFAEFDGEDEDEGGEDNDILDILYLDAEDFGAFDQDDNQDDDQDDQYLADEFEAADDTAPELIAASNTDPATELSNAQVDLATARAAELEVQLATLQRELDARNFEAERDQLARDYGIPPAITNLARPLLEGSTVVELSNGASVDAGQVMRDVLRAIGEHVRLVDLSSPVGSALDAGPADDDADRKAWVAQARQLLGI